VTDALHRVDVDKVALVAANATLTSTNASLIMLNAGLHATVASLHEELAESVSLQMFREVHRAAAGPVIEAIHAVNGSHVTASTIEPAPVSRNDVVQFLTALGWSQQEVESFKSQGVTGEVLFTDMNAAMYESFGVSPLHIVTLTRTLRQWKNGWGD
jgi:hypothetical protein